MQNKLLITLLVTLTPIVSFAQRTPALLNDYCVQCHNLEDWAGSLDIESIDFEHVSADPDIWEKIIRKMNAGMMPPSDQKRPDAAEIESFIALLENKLDDSAPNFPAAPALHRLNRFEYKNAIRDLLHLTIDSTVLLPQDDSSEGFDNIASSLGFSPALIQAYTNTAMKISRLAVGDMSLTESTSRYEASPNLSHAEHIDGMPLGSRGGMKIDHHFPLDGEYEFSVRTGFGRGQAILYDVNLDGERIEIESPRKFRIPISAGEHTLTVSLIDIRSSAGVNDIYSEYQKNGAVSSVEITGPFNVTGLSTASSSRQSIFSCYPSNNDEETACAEQIMIELANKAFREPVSLEDIQAVMAFYQQGYREGNFETGIQQGLSRILVDPRFLFRFEESQQQSLTEESHAISDLELASRLSFFLWSSIPDKELLELASQGRLSQAETLQQQTLRMLKDPKSSALVVNFADQWLHLREMASLTPEASDFDENLRLAFIEETRSLFNNIIEENRPVTEFIDADYTFLNERLARHYGITGVYGSHFRKVPLASDSPRRGLLGQGSILTITSTASRTSPVIRGSWILENLLHAPVPSPPAGVETNLEGDGEEVLTNSIRERLEVHRSDPNCESCHSIIDPVGFALENFDLIGAWREFDGDSPVDSSGVLFDGTKINGTADLRAAILAQSDIFVQTLTEKLLTYALGRGLEYYDMPLVRSIVKETEEEEYRFASLISAIVKSEQFLKRAEEPETMEQAVGVR